MKTYKEFMSESFGMSDDPEEVALKKLAKKILGLGSKTDVGFDSYTWSNSAKSAEKTYMKIVEKAKSAGFTPVSTKSKDTSDGSSSSGGTIYKNKDGYLMKTNILYTNKAVYQVILKAK